MESDFKYGTDGLTFDEHIKRYGSKNDPDHDKRMSGELPRLDIGKDGKQQKGRPIRSINHGTIYAYRKRGCRCDKCKEAIAQSRERRRLPENEGMHGILSWAIHNECTCEKCQDVIEKMETENAKRNK